MQQQDLVILSFIAGPLIIVGSLRFFQYLVNKIATEEGGVKETVELDNLFLLSSWERDLQYFGSLILRFLGRNPEEASIESGIQL